MLQLLAGSNENLHKLSSNFITFFFFEIPYLENDGLADSSSSLSPLKTPKMSELTR